MTNNDFNRMLLNIVLEIMALKKQEKTDLVIGQLMAYKRVLILAGLDEDQADAILKGYDKNEKL